MTPTRIPVLVALFIGAGAVAFSGAELWLTRGTPPGVPVLAPIVLLAIAVVALATGLSLRQRFHGQREHRVDARPVNPLTAARAAMFAKASSLVGSLIGGVYAGYGIYLLRDLDIEARRTTAERCGWSVGAAVLLVITGLFLERVCRIPDDEDDNGPRRQR